MDAPSGILAFTTSNYDAMTQFFRALGFEVRETPGDQLVPLFTRGRGAYISRHEIVFNLEESDRDTAAACFKLLLFGCGQVEIERLSVLGYAHTTEVSLYGTSHRFTSPDGGQVCLCV